MRALVWDERGLAVTGLVGYAGAALTLIVASGVGRYIPPQGDLMKVASGFLALATVLVTLAAILPLADLGVRGRSWWRRVMIGCAIYAYVWEPSQHLLGLDPRFTVYPSSVPLPIELVHRTLRGLYFLTSQAYIVLFVVLAGQLFRDRVYRRDPIVVLALRYAFGSVFAHSFLAGFWMLANRNLSPIGDLAVRSGRYVGESGDIIVLHAVGFHALQALPLLALLIIKSPVSVSTGRALVHFSGGSWLAASFMIAWQTALGYNVSSVTLVMLGYTTLFAAWAGSAAYATWFLWFGAATPARPLRLVRPPEAYAGSLPRVTVSQGIDESRGHIVLGGYVGPSLWRTR